MTKALGRKGKSFQSGGSLPAFHGVRVQRGYGLGSLFGSLAHAVIPVFKQGAKPIGKAAVKTGFNIAKDVLSGQNIKTAAKKRAQETGAHLVNKAVRSIQSRITPQTGAGIKRKGAQTTVTSSQIKRARTSPQIAPIKAKAKQNNTTAKNPANQRKVQGNRDIFGVY